MTDKPAMEQVRGKVLESIYKEVRTELAKCRSQQAIADRSGFVISSVDRFASSQKQDDQSASAFPEFLPISSVPLPEPIVQLRREMRCNSRMGLFPSISRAWISVDNTIILWNYATGVEFISFPDIPEVVVNCILLQPKPSVFSPFIHKLLLVMTPSTVSILGLNFSDVSNVHRSPVKLLQLDYSVRTSSPLTHAVQHDKSLKVFSSGLDGNLYEIVINPRTSRITPKIQLVNHTIYFGKTPLLCNVGHALSTFQQTWLQRNPICRDVALDQQKQTIYILCDDNVVDSWTLTDAGVPTRSTKVKHDCPVSNPLKQLFPIVGGHVATSLNGTRYVYEMHQKYVVDPAVLSKHVLTTSFLADNVFIGAHVDPEGADSSDVISMTVTPYEISPPHHKKREVVSVSYPSTTPATRVEAICELPLLADQSAGMAGDLCRQIVAPPRQFVLLHRYGIDVQAKLRPVDLLHLILNVSEQCPHLLVDFFRTFSEIDSCAMLFQIASGNIGTSTLLLDPFTGSPGHVIRRLSYSSPSRKHVSEEDLGQVIVNPVAPEVSKKAAELLRLYFAIDWRSIRDTETQITTKTAEVSLSVFCVAANIYVARSLFCIWDEVVFSSDASNLKESKIAPILNILADYETVLKQFSPELWNVALHFKPGCTTQWKTSIVVFPQMASDVVFNDNDAYQVHNTKIYGISLALDRCLQILQLLLQLTRVTDSVMKAVLKGRTFENVTFSDLVSKESLALDLVRTVVRTLIHMEAQSTVPQYESIKNLLEVFERECPALYNQTDAVEYQARMDLDHMMKKKGGPIAATATSVVVGLSQKAGSLWRAGQLPELCNQLILAGDISDAVSLYLHAAAQIDVNQAVTERFLVSNADPKAFETQLQDKIQIATTITELLEQLWVSNRLMFDQLLGIPYSTDGKIWMVAPSDLVMHKLLLHWLQAPRAEGNVRAHFRNLLICAATNCLEQFLTRNPQLKLEAASFYRNRQQEPGKAIQCYMSVVNSPLTEMEPDMRMKTRFMCLNDAKSCALEGHWEGHTDQIGATIEHLEAQNQLLEVMRRFLHSGDECLHSMVEIEGKPMTQREFVLHQMDKISSGIFDPQLVFEMALRYINVGGAEVQLRLLNYNKVGDPMIYCETLLAALGQASNSFEDNALHIVSTYYDPLLFPLDYAVKIIEAYYFDIFPSGCPAVIDLLEQARIGLDTIFTLYCDLMSAPQLSNAYKPFDSGVTRGYKLHSCCVALRKLVFSKGQQRIQVGFVARAVQMVRDQIDPLLRQSELAEGGNDEAEAIRAAILLWDECQKVL